MPYKDPQKQREYSRAYLRKWEAAKEKDPAYRAQRRVRAREWYARGVGTGRIENDPAKWLPRALAHANYRAKMGGIPCGIAVEDVVASAVCPILGVSLVYGGRGNNSASLDRVVPSKGYVKGNVIVISRRANRIKSDATEAELAAILAYTRGHS